MIWRWQRRWLIWRRRGRRWRRWRGRLLYWCLRGRRRRNTAGVKVDAPNVGWVGAGELRDGERGAGARPGKLNGHARRAVGVTVGSNRFGAVCTRLCERAPGGWVGVRHAHRKERRDVEERVHSGADRHGIGAAVDEVPERPGLMSDNRHASKVRKGAHPHARRGWQRRRRWHRRRRRRVGTRRRAGGRRRRARRAYRVDGHRAYQLGT